MFVEQYVFSKKNLIVVKNCVLYRFFKHIGVITDPNYSQKRSKWANFFFMYGFNLSKLINNWYENKMFR